MRWGVGLPTSSAKHYIQRVAFAEIRRLPSVEHPRSRLGGHRVLAEIAVDALVCGRLQIDGADLKAAT